ncbi:MAG TPA: Cof-type HAD-IIB family hydrolase [Fimbriimonadaceae bacterium]|nr:Cof-type HAD-IIB family hydrolase [Fimbriimonadaceae bacterium]
MSASVSSLRLIAVDCDGTLLTHARVPHPDSAAALRRAQEAGIVVVLASGRAPSTMTPIARQCGLTGPTVSCNGAFVMDAEGATIAHFHLEDAIRDELVRFGQARALHTNLYSGSQVLMSTGGEFAQEYQRRTGLGPVPVVGYEAMSQHTATKLLYFDHPPVIEDAVANAPGSHGVDYELVRSEADYVEFLPLGIHKGRGLQILCESLGIQAHEVAAIGDYFNDKEMLEWAGYAGVMGGAPDPLKLVADIVVGTNDEGGVANFVESILNP